jgi:tRNA threonylcarbamoyladenosine biosynthesis protein TsaB
MIILAIDTSANLCAAAVWETNVGERGREVRDIGKGHAEQLMDVIELALSAATLTMADLGAIAVSVGPGSFTGVRIGVAAARGLALALKVPAIGISTLEALAEEALAGHADREVLALIDAGRDQVYAAGYRADGTTTLPPIEMGFKDVVALAAAGNLVLTGSAAEAVARAAGTALDIAGNRRTADIATFARLAARRDGAVAERPKPLYLRGADAKPQTGFALPRKAEP